MIISFARLNMQSILQQNENKLKMALLISCTKTIVSG